MPNGYIWITQAKEVENYIPKIVLEKIWEKKRLPKIGQFEFFSHKPTKTNKQRGYLQKHKWKSINKVELAQKVASHLTEENLSNVFELKKEMNDICEEIRNWNK